jgi:hypothetical protein
MERMRRRGRGDACRNPYSQRLIVTRSLSQPPSSGFSFGGYGSNAKCHHSSGFHCGVTRKRKRDGTGHCPIRTHHGKVAGVILLKRLCNDEYKRRMGERPSQNLNSELSASVVTRWPSFCAEMHRPRHPIKCRHCAPRGTSGALRRLSLS